MCPECQANAELVPTLPNGIRQNPVDANTGEHECGAGEAADEQHCEAGLGSGIVNEVFGGLNFVYWLIAVDSGDLGAMPRT